MFKHSDIIGLLDEIEYETIRTNKKIEYINLASGFDIETSSVKVEEEKAAFMYIWALGIGHNKGVYYGRSWDDFLNVCDLLQQAFNLNRERRLVIYVHNLGYEFQFMRKYFNWLEVFAVAERKPIKALCEYGIEFRCSYILSGYSLANTAKNLTNYKIKKLVGDLDYSLVRTPHTPLTPVEMGYVNNDIEIVTAYIQEQIDLYGDVSKIPMTNTGRVRKHVRQECYYSSTNHRKSSKNKYSKYRKIMGDLTIDPETYIQLKRAFMGGFTHANANYVGKTLDNVSSIDFTSSYPAVMVSEKFPMSRFRKIEIDSVEHLDKLSETRALVFNVKFHNLRWKITQETYISESKCFNLKNPVVNNGRIVSADSLSTTLTEIDYQIMKQVYEWDAISIADCRMAFKNYLPRSIIKSILDLYKDKTVLKGVEGSEVEYMLSKGMLNSIYGMSVTDIVKDNSVYNSGEWETEKVDVEEEIKDYNESKNRFLFYAWGLWVTAYARKNLWTGIIATGDDYVYSDTDSLKIKNYDKYVPYIQWFDAQIIDKMQAMCGLYKFPLEMLSPKTKTGEHKTIGVWDFEGTYSKFKTLGAKRYLTMEGEKLEITVAGLSKQNGLAYMRELAGNDENVFSLFTDSLYIPAERTGKMTHTYIDDELKFKCLDYLGNEETVNPLSSIHLESCDFTLNVADQYKQFLQNLSKGYIFKGVKHV